MLADASETFGTTDYADDIADAIAIVKTTVGLFDEVIADLVKEGRAAEAEALQRENGQKVRQLQVELDIQLHKE